VEPAAILLTGIVGSTAYGLAGPDSDIDRIGVYAAATLAFHGLHPPVGKADSIISNHPDQALHEALKFARLCLSGNPTVMELLWLPDQLYEVRTDLGDALIGIRSAFLSAPRVRDAYLGYAMSQFQRLDRRRDGTFSSDRRRRTSKHARHLLRLLDQGLRLYTTGELVVRLEDPAHYLDFGESVAADPEQAKPALARAEAEFDAARPALPEHPNESIVESWLLSVRQRYLTP
jgi:predicted nucleotidyltransferase